MRNKQEQWFPQSVECLLSVCRPFRETQERKQVSQNNCETTVPTVDSSILHSTRHQKKIGYLWRILRSNNTYEQSYWHNANEKIIVTITSQKSQDL